MYLTRRIRIAYKILSKIQSRIAARAEFPFQVFKNGKPKNVNMTLEFPNDWIDKSGDKFREKLKEKALNFSDSDSDVKLANVIRHELISSPYGNYDKTVRELARIRDICDRLKSTNSFHMQVWEATQAIMKMIFPQDSQKRLSRIWTRWRHHIIEEKDFPHQCLENSNQEKWGRELTAFKRRKKNRKACGDLFSHLRKLLKY